MTGDSLARELAAARALIDDATISARPAVRHLAAAIAAAGGGLDLGELRPQADAVRVAARAEPWQPVELPSRRRLRRLLRRLEAESAPLRARRRWRQIGSTVAAVAVAAVVVAVALIDRAARLPDRWRVSYQTPTGEREAGAPAVDWSLAPAGSAAARYRGCLLLERDRPLALQIVADGRATVSVDGRVVVDSAGDRVAAAVVSLARGTHPIEIDFRAPPGGGGALALQASVDNRRPTALDPALLRPDGCWGAR